MSHTSQGSISEKTLIVGHHYPAIDGLRGFAVLLVIWFHASIFAHEVNPAAYTGFLRFYYNFTVLGSTGVDLFFILSGFLITGILIDTAYEKGIFKNFYIRRALRIFPLYYLCLALFTVVCLASGKDIFSDMSWLTHLFYLQNWSVLYNFDSYMYLNHTWSLAVEEQFYLLWPFLFLAVYKRSMKMTIVMCLVLILSSGILRSVFYHQDFQKLSYSATICRLDGLILGALLAVLCKNYKAYMRKHIDVFLYCMVVTSLVVVVMAISSADYNAFHGLLISLGLVVCNIFYACLLVCIFLGGMRSGICALFRNKYLQGIGRVSYGVYIVHVPVMIVIGYYMVSYEMTYWWNHILLLIGGSVVSVILALLSYKFFESPILRLKSKYAPLTMTEKSK